MGQEGGHAGVQARGKVKGKCISEIVTALLLCLCDRGFLGLGSFRAGISYGADLEKQVGWHKGKALMLRYDSME